MELNHGWGMRRKRSLDARKDGIPGYYKQMGEMRRKLTWVDVVWLGSGHQLCYHELLVFLI